MFKNIVVSGDIGTGKTTLSKSLAAKFGWKHVNAGDYFRQWHSEHRIPLDDVDIPEKIDRQFDEDFKDKIRTEQKTIFESRLAGWMARDFGDIFKILCVADPEVALDRVSKRDEMGIEETREKLAARSDGLAVKFKKLYGVDDYLNPEYFDLVVDTTKLSKEEVLDLVLKKLNTTD